MWGGALYPKTVNAAEFYLLLLALFILTSILNVNFLAQMILDINKEYWNYWKKCLCVCTVDLSLFNFDPFFFYVLYIFCMGQAAWGERDDEDDDDN